MNKKAVVIFVALFLSVLFLSTLGSVYTGNVVLQQTEITLSNYPYPFVKNNVPNDVFIVIPYDYSYDDYSTAQFISNSLKGNNLLGPEI
ncbi:hypothetical protein HYU23_03250 [Candidatus Woesearchaeota archaeon]|nr:hypothetical protein [Candidatus Woesearchaeota archaeon]